MAERTFIPSSPACGQWETLLADALDGLLKPEDEVTFNAHRAVCPACSALYEEARKGREWLEFLSPEPEVPAGLLARILAVTGPGQALGYGLATAGGNVLPIHPASIPAPAWQRPGFMAHLRRFAEPRLMLTAAMAFFSIAMTLGLTGVRFSSLRLSSLRPAHFPAKPVHSSSGDSPWLQPPSSATTITRGWFTRCKRECGSCAGLPRVKVKAKAATSGRNRRTHRPASPTRPLRTRTGAPGQTRHSSLLVRLLNQLSTILTFWKVPWHFCTGLRTLAALQGK